MAGGRDVLIRTRRIVTESSSNVCYHHRDRDEPANEKYLPRTEQRLAADQASQVDAGQEPRRLGFDIALGAGQLTGD